MSDTLETTIEAAMSRIKETHDAILPEVRAEREREREDFRRRQTESRTKELLIEGRAPKRQLANSNVDRSGPWGDTERKILAMLGTTGCLIALIGTRGSGKTQLAVEAMRVTCGKGKKARFCTATGFFMEIKAAYNSNGRCTEKEVFEQFLKPSLLVIDEIGQRSENDWENKLLFALLNDRYADMKDTIVASNQSAEEFSKSIGPSLISRMQEAGGLIKCDWPSYRVAMP